MANAPRPLGFHAQVDGASLSDLIQMNCLGGQRAAFRVSSGNRVGYLFFEGGRVIHAEFAGSFGEEAVSRLLVLESGNFQPCQRPWPLTPSINTSWETLLLRAAVAQDERANSQERGRIVEFPGATRVMERATEVETESGAVRLTKNGDVISSEGNAEALAETAAFVHALADLVGDALGLGEVHAVEASSTEASVVTYKEAGGTLVAVRGTPLDLTELRKQLGLE